MDNSYYVYVHKDPDEEGDVRYVGRGRRDRAWQCRGSQRMYDKHVEWLESLLSQGLTMGDVVEIKAKGLDKQDATQLELEYIAMYAPEFNRSLGGPKLITNEDIELAKVMREQGSPYSEIAEHLGYSTMTIWRNLNG